MEHIRTAKVENVKLLDKVTPKSSPIGTLYLTTSHLIFIDEKEKKELWILHMLMQTIKKPVLTTSGSQLKILCSNFQNVTFMISVSVVTNLILTPVRFPIHG
jgi:myotubularin-related protein 6/7/8